MRSYSSSRGLRGARPSGPTGSGISASRSMRIWNEDRIGAPPPPPLPAASPLVLGRELRCHFCVESPDVGRKLAAVFGVDVQVAGEATAALGHADRELRAFAPRADLVFPQLGLAEPRLRVLVDQLTDGGRLLDGRLADLDGHA